MDQKEIFNYYSRRDVQKALCDSSKDKEAVARYGDGFGKRPDILQMPGDILDLAKRGATSFHISEERWKDPLALQPGLTKKQLDELRLGWDLIIDIDSKYWEFSKYTTYLVYEALKFYNLKHISVKFSGGKGWHLGVPYEAFPEEVQGYKTKNLFPDGIRIVASFIIEKIKPELNKYLMSKESIIRELATNSPEEYHKIIKEGIVDIKPFLELDTVLISSRHLFRAPYSLHEKSGLVSIPINPKDILTFEKSSAAPDKINTNLKFMDRTEVTPNEGRDLIIQAFDWYFEQQKKKQSQSKDESKKDGMKIYEENKDLIKADYFPPCILNILKGDMPDGKKRALFVLVNFLKQMNWSYELMENTIKEWNNKNSEPLRENYVLAQLLSAKRQGKMMPPNCANSAYYIDTCICKPNAFCPKIKNPANYSLLQHKIAKKS